ncbi:response regulator [Brevundimonas sp.]|uniref:hybrid sensor histidine kinase/response regulator n=1 Tax=Brevundimonas sp. TaxID=1871086 RepID=UPI0028A9704E|nr:response regulator [Brevundimonas sp.]
MDIVLLVLALALTGAAAGIWMWLRTRRIAAGLHRRNAGLERQVAERTAALRRALSAADADSRRLAEDNRAKTELLRAIGRELRTPLTTVMGFSQWLQANPDADPLTHRQSEALRQIEAAGGVLWALVEEADDVIAAHEAVCMLSAQRVDMRLALRQVCDGLEPQARAAGVVLACPPPTSGLGVVGDPARVRHILRRLMLNAIRHTPAGGTVRLELERIDDRVVTTVFDPDCALDDPVDRLACPLGVTTARQLAERMGGAIATAIGAEGEAIFALSLPAAGAAPVEGRQGAVVLYIEDNLANIALLRQVAGGLGLTLYSATSGPEGLDLARSLRPDLVLLDIGLPGMDGYEVKTHLGLDPATCGIPVLALTAAASPSDIRKGRAAGFDAYLTKPLDLPALATALNSALRSAPAAASATSAA